MSLSTQTSPRQDARISERIREFFYREEVPFSLAIIRFLMPLVLLSVMLPRWFDARELYSADGAPSPLGARLWLAQSAAGVFRRSRRRLAQRIDLGPRRQFHRLVHAAVVGREHRALYLPQHARFGEHDHQVFRDRFAHHAVAHAVALRGGVVRG